MLPSIEKEIFNKPNATVVSKVETPQPYRVSSMQNETFPLLILTKPLQIGTKYLYKIFCILMFINFSNILLWYVYPDMITHQQQCIFIIYDRERNKLAEKKAIFKTIKIN